MVFHVGISLDRYISKYIYIKKKHFIKKSGKYIKPTCVEQGRGMKREMNKQRTIRRTRKMEDHKKQEIKVRGRMRRNLLV